MKKVILALLIGILSINPAYAYDPDTHQKMSEKAFGTSVLTTDTKVLDNLGLPPLSAEKKYPNSQLFSQQRTIVELFQDGANFEDSLLRPANHFFDPLTGKGLAVGSPSPDWAIDGTGDSSTIKFSFKAAREYLWQATANPLNNYDYRQKQFGLMFRSLGQVIHHIQDMAQPQHVRNDLHCDNPLCYPLGIYNPSLYEKYTKEAGIALRLPYTNTDYTASTQVKFDTARKFWTTTVNGNGNTGQGMAEFTNRNFVSAGTNFALQNGAASPSSRYQSPKLNGASSIGDVATLFAAAGKPVPAGCTDALNPCTMTFYASTVTDSLLGKTYTNQRATTRSMFDDALVASGKTITYTDPDTGQLITTDRLFALNQFNYDAAQQFLIPRAVAYSAGLINYFFYDLTSRSQT